jgi:hypothetical protein
MRPLVVEKKLLRLKCEAYSTLNEADEDPEAEVRLQNRMGQAGGLSPPKASLVAPASLYLTAILECVAVTSALSLSSLTGTVCPRVEHSASMYPSDWVIALRPHRRQPGISCPMLLV